MSATLRWLPKDARIALLAEGTDAFRLADSPSAWIEQFGEAVLISAAGRPWTPAQAEQALGEGGVRARHVFFRRLVHAPGPRDAPSRLSGAGAADQVRATEASIHYLLNFEAGYSCGLFLDQRANRARLRSLAPARLLNLFAYTCSFSVCAALAGAETTSVDLSKAALERGRANFAANSLPTAGHRLLAEDVFDVLPRLARRGEKFDALIVDPPTFSRGRRGRIFRAAEGLASLTELALACAAPGAHVLLSSNASAITTRHLAAIARKLGGSQLLAPPPLPDIPPSRAAAAIWFRAP